MADNNDLYNIAGSSDFYQSAQLLQNGLNAWSNMESQYKANKTNKEISEMSNEWAYKTALDMADVQANNEYNLWLRQLLTNQYTPKMEQLRTAGINPFVAAGKVANVQSESLHAASPSVPHPTSFPYQPYLMPTDSVSSLLQGISALSQSRKADEETDRLKRLAIGEIEGQFWDNKRKEFDLKLDDAFAGLERNNSLQKLKASIRTEVNLAYKYSEEGDLANMNYHLTNARRYREELAGQMDEKRYERIDTLLDLEEDNLRSSSEKNRASARESIAHAGLFNSQRLSEDAARAFEEKSVRPYVAQMIMNDAQMSNNDMVDYYTNRQERLQAELNELERAGIINQRERAQLKSDVAKGDFADVRELFETVGAAARAYRDYNYRPPTNYRLNTYNITNNNNKNKGK